MTATQIKDMIANEQNHLALNKNRMDSDELAWVNAKIADLESKLTQGRYEEKVLKYGWKSVERNA